MYVAGRSHPLREPARRFLEQVRSGELEGCTSTEVLQEILYRYAALKRLDLARQVYELFVLLCPVVYPVTLADTDAQRNWSAQKTASGPRCHPCRRHAQQRHPGHRHFDAGFDAIKQVRRLPF